MTYDVLCSVCPYYIFLSASFCTVGEQNKAAKAKRQLTQGSYVVLLQTLRVKLPEVPKIAHPFPRSFLEMTPAGNNIAVEYWRRDLRERTV
jgi:hypothetical protein